MEKAKAYYSEAAAEGNEEAMAKQEQLVAGNTNAGIDIPGASPRDLENIVLMCDGTLKTPNGDGTFNSNEDMIVASTDDEQLIYLSFRNPSRDKSKDKLVLDATETALSFLMWGVPFSFDSMEEEEYAGMRKLLLSFTETQVLISAIESSVSELGYLDLERIANEAENASEKINSFFKPGTSIKNTFNKPIVSINRAKSINNRKQGTSDENQFKDKPCFKGGSPYYYKGIKLVLKDVSSVPDSDKWKCKITVYNYEPIYLALTAGIKQGETIIPVGESVLDHIVKPQNSNYIFAIGGLDGVIDTGKALASFWGDTYLWIAGEKEFEDGYWNATETNFEMEIDSEEDVLLVWSADSDCPELFAYSFFKLCVIPIIKMIFKSDDKTFESELWNVFLDTGTDPKFIQRAMELNGKSDLGDYLVFIWDTSMDLLYDCLNKLPEKLWKKAVEPRYQKVIKKWSKYEEISNNKLATKAQFKADMGELKLIKNLLKAERIFINSVTWSLYQREFHQSYFDFSFDNVPMSVVTGEPYKADYVNWVNVPVEIVGGSPVTQSGIVWSYTNEIPTLSGEGCTKITQTDAPYNGKKITVQIKDIPGHTKLFIRSFITINKDNVQEEVIYGNVVEYTTPWDDIITQGLNEIWYTTTDGNIAAPYAADAFGGNTIVANVYDGGKGRLVFDEPLEEIGENAFMNCNTLETLDLPKSLISLGAHAFESCSSLSTVFFPVELDSCGDCAFRGCDKLTRFNGYGASPNGRFLVVDKRLVGFASYDYDVMDIVIPSGVESISPYIFNGQDYIHTITIPESLKDVGEKAFCNCKSIEELTFPAGLKTFGDLPIYQCSSLKSVRMTPVAPPVRAGTLVQGAASDFKIYVPNASLQAYKTAPKWSDDADIIFPEDPVNPDGSLAGTPPNNEIWYTSTDGNIVTPNIPIECISNTYENGFGRIVCANEIGYIKSYAFRGCTTLKSIVLPDSVHPVPQYIGFFRDCSSLEKAVLPSSWGSCIHNYMFSGCGKLKEVIIPESVSRIGSYAFENCSSLETVQVPSGLTDVGTKAFYGCSSVKSVLLPDSVTFIGESCFQNCSSMEEFHMPEGINAIQARCFAGCSSLKNIIIPEGVASLDDFAFYNCSSITTVVIPEGITGIPYCAFGGCASLKTVSLPSTLTGIYHSAFGHCTSLKSIRIPDSVTILDEYSFAYCTSLESITIPESVTAIKSYAFYDSGLKNVAVEGETSIEFFAFLNCKSLVSLRINGGSIGSQSFSGCVSLVIVELGTRVTQIDDQAFLGCSSLADISIPGSVSSIGTSAFKNCSGLTQVTLNHGLTSINYGAFQNCSSLRTISIPVSVVSIGEYAFSSCVSLSQVDLAEGVETIGAYAFRDCSSLLGITIPNTVAKVGDFSFAGCTNLSRVIIEDGVGAIGQYAFWDCSLLSITVPGGVKLIGGFAFRGCTKLSQIILKEGLETIDAYGFAECPSLQIITIPASVTLMGDDVFSGCSSFKSLTLRATTPIKVKYSNYSFNIPIENEALRIYVPAGSVEAYKTADGWGRYADIIYPIGSY